MLLDFCVVLQFAGEFVFRLISFNQQQKQVHQLPTTHWLMKKLLVSLRYILFCHHHHHHQLRHIHMPILHPFTTISLLLYTALSSSCSTDGASTRLWFRWFHFALTLLLNQTFHSVSSLVLKQKQWLKQQPHLLPLYTTLNSFTFLHLS